MGDEDSAGGDSVGVAVVQWNRALVNKQFAMESYPHTSAFESGQAGPGGFRPPWLLCALMLVFTTSSSASETTLYVGKHFEVREHEAPVKYVFNGSTRVARVTGSLSANERIQRLRLRAGWNLVSLAVTAPDFFNQLRDFTEGPAPVIQALYRWQPATKNFGTVPSGETVAAGTVLWISTRTNGIVAVRGGYVEPAQWNVPTGGTFVATPALEAQPLTIPPGVTIWRYDARDRRWQAGLPGDIASLSDLPSTLSPGEAIYVHSSEPTDLGSPAREERLRYYHQDHLGSSSVMTDSDGALVEETAFYPFGVPRHAHRLRPSEEPYQFTQKERDKESGLHYFEARFLAGLSGRFITVDPKYAAMGAATSDPQALNLYAYARNSPVLYVDPTGLDFEVPEVAGSVDEIDWDTTAEAMVGFLDSTWFGSAIKAPPRVRDAASFIGGIGDGIVDPMAQFAGAKTFGMGFGQFTRMAFGINSVDTSSPDYGGGKVLGTVVTFATGGAEAVALSAFRRAPSVAKSVIDPLADTAPAGGISTAASRGSGVGQIRSAPIGGGAIHTTPLVGGGGGLGAAETAYMKLFQQQNQSLQAMRTIALGGEVQIDSAITRMAFEQADAIWRSTYGTRPPLGIPRR